MKNLPTNILLGLLSLVALGVFYFLFLLAQPFRLPTVTPYPIPIINKDKTVHYGEPIQTRVRSCTYESVPVTVSVRYQDHAGRVYYFSSHDSVTRIGCHNSIQNREPIPDSLPPSKYKIYITAVFHVNKLKDVTKVYETEEFRLVSK